jgi:hypothetical protein
VISWLCGLLPDGGDGLALAQINGTILAILIAAATAYVLIFLQTLEAMKTDLIDRANQINHLVFSSQIGSADVENCQLATPDERLRLMQYLVGGYAESAPPPPSTGSMRGIPWGATEEAKMRRAKLAGAMMSKIAGSYPFAMGSRQPVQLTSESQVREWLPDLEKAVRMLDSLLVGGRNLLPAWMDWLDQEEPVGTRIEIFPTAIRRLLPKPALRAMEGGFHRSVYHEFVDLIRRAREIALATREAAARIDRYHSRLPAAWRLTVAGLLATVVFVCGVAWPMVHPDVSSLVSAWVPAVAYVASLLGGLWWVVKSRDT